MPTAAPSRRLTALRSREQVAIHTRTLHRAFDGLPVESVTDTFDELMEAADALPPNRRAMIYSVLCVAFAPIVWEIDDAGVSVLDEAEATDDGVTVVSGERNGAL